MVYFGCPQLVQPVAERRDRGRAADRLAARQGVRDRHGQLRSPRGAEAWPRPRRRITSSRWASPRPPPAGTSSPAAIRPPPGRWATPSVSATGWIPKGEQYLHQAAIYVCTPAGRVSRTIRGVRVRRGSAPRFADPRLAGEDQLRPVRRGPVLRTGPFRPATRANTPGPPWPSCG